MDRQFLLIPTCVCNVAVSVALMIWESGRSRGPPTPRRYADLHACRGHKHCCTCGTHMKRPACLRRGVDERPLWGLIEKRLFSWRTFVSSCCQVPGARLVCTLCFCAPPPDLCAGQAATTRACPHTKQHRTAAPWCPSTRWISLRSRRTTCPRYGT